MSWLRASCNMHTYLYSLHVLSGIRIEFAFSAPNSVKRRYLWRITEHARHPPEWEATAWTQDCDCAWCPPYWYDSKSKLFLPSSASEVQKSIFCIQIWRIPWMQVSCFNIVLYRQASTQKYLVYRQFEFVCMEPLNPIRRLMFWY